jgi:hypothetical protein
MVFLVLSWRLRHGPGLFIMPTKKVTKSPVAAKTAAAKSGTPAAPAKKTVPAKPLGKKTIVIAKSDVGWGNSIYLRGQGGGLSWDVGVLMDCLKKDEWIWSCPSSDGAITFKFVRNDLHWALGKDQVVAAGETSVSTPQFPPWQ